MPLKWLVLPKICVKFYPRWFRKTSLTGSKARKLWHQFLCIICKQNSIKMKSNITGRAKININAPLSKIWDALTKPEIIRKYFFGTETDYNLAKRKSDHF